MKYFSFVVLFLALPLITLAQTATSTNFVPLTNIPAITEVGNAITTPDGLALFLNNIYRLCIGIAAVVAVLQIMRAGIIYMGGDSVTEKKEAKNLIALAIGGLILVLSPVIVFSIINPEILSLKIGGIDKLQTKVGVCEPACGVGESCVSGTCLENNVVGDGTCALSCTAGNECKQGSCVPVESGSCPANIANGVAVPSVHAQNCCAAQNGCSVTIRYIGGDEETLGTPVCSCQQTGAINVDSPLDIVKYMQLANTGIGTDRGPVGSMRDLFNRYTSACTAAGKQVQEEYDERRRCSTEEMNDYTGTEASEPYIWCVPTTLTCTASN